MKERLKQIRLEAGLKQHHIAELLEVSISAVSNYENGDRTPSPAQITLLCDHFNISREWLINGTGPKHPTRDRKEELSHLFGKAMKEGNANRMAFLSIGLRMTPEQVEQWAQMFLEVAAELQKEKKPES